MNTQLLDAAAVRKKLKQLIKESKTISIAVAWGHLTPTAKSLLKHKDKFGKILIGTDFSATQLELVNKLVDVPNTYVVQKTPGCFHPKIYYFETDKNASAIVGSSNFTKGGIIKNIEANVFLEGNLGEKVFQQIREQLQSYEEYSHPVTLELAEAYGRAAKQAQSLKRPQNPKLPDTKAGIPPLSSMSWETFASLAQSNRHEDYDPRMRLIRYARKTFTRSKSFSDLSQSERAVIAGLPRLIISQKKHFASLECGWFGQMDRSKPFEQGIANQHPGLAKAIDGIPQKGEVAKSQFDQYASAFKIALDMKNPLGTATRLLALKRPDFFVCINGPNQTHLSVALDFSPTTLTLENYWDRVIKPIHASPWYKAPKPEGKKDSALWKARVAMLDAIYYQAD